MAANAGREQAPKPFVLSDGHKKEIGTFLARRKGARPEPAISIKEQVSGKPVAIGLVPGAAHIGNEEADHLSWVRLRNAMGVANKTMANAPLGQVINATNHKGGKVDEKEVNEG